ncbi:MAG TPA: hypothetical protein VLA29_05280 [Acidimicrobiia bacterium]|nr:hypothetical protein [Acidimicrobiia bacterium]
MSSAWQEAFRSSRERATIAVTPPDDVHSQTTFVPGNRLKTPRAAGFAGIIFALLLGASYVLIRLSIPVDPSTGPAWIDEQAEMVTFALSLVPLSGIAFLWFIGVIRDRVGDAEDRFFATVFLGSGLLYLAMLFVSAGLAGALVATYQAEPVGSVESGLYAYGREVTYRISSVYAIRMAGVFMISLGTIFVRTKVAPRWLAILTYGLALILLVSVNYSLWLTLVFPAWVLMISLHILWANLRSGGDFAKLPESATEQ